MTDPETPPVDDPFNPGGDDEVTDAPVVIDPDPWKQPEPEPARPIDTRTAFPGSWL